MIGTLSERNLKEICLGELIRLRRINTSTVISSEFPLTALGVRADLAFLNRTKFTAVEIKSDHDSVRRLPNQLKHFSENFDRLILVLAGYHAKRTLNEIPQNVEVWRIGLGQNYISKYRARKDNRPRTSLLQLMTAKERLKYLPNTSSEKVSEASARAAFFKSFRDRYSTTSERFWNTYQKDESRKISLEPLSRLNRRRELDRSIQQGKAEQIEAWLKYQSDQDSSVS